MSNMKYEAIVAAGITVGERVPIPDALVPPDARVEIDAKLAAGYFTEGTAPAPGELARPKGRGVP
jgi:GTP cyclohydrolase II